MFLPWPVEGAAFISFSMSSFSSHNRAFREGAAHGNKTSPMIRCHFLNPASESYLRIRPAGSKLKAIAGGTSSQGR